MLIKENIELSKQQQELSGTKQLWKMRKNMINEMGAKENFSENFQGDILFMQSERAGEQLRKMRKENQKLKQVIKNRQSELQKDRKDLADVKRQLELEKNQVNSQKSKC